MWVHRPRYDDTFGVPMDLGAHRKDPLSPRSRPSPVRQARPQTVLVEQPRSLFDLFRPSPDQAPRRAEKERPGRPRPSAPRPSLNQPAPDGGFRQLEAFAAGIWKRLSVQHRIVLAIGGAWFLLVTGLFVPAIVIGVFYAVIRNQKRDAA